MASPHCNEVKRTRALAGGLGLWVGLGGACAPESGSRASGTGDLITAGVGEATGSADSGGTESEQEGESGAATSTTGDVADADSGEPKFDLASETTGLSCPPGDPCCDPDASLDHQLLEDFLAAYPAANMPTEHDAIRDFAPMTDNGATMTWSKGKVGGEFVDPSNGGLIAENLLAGRDKSRGAAEAAVPVGATVVNVREDPVEIVALPDGIEPCVGVGWAWGSLVYEDVDQSINELAFLYIGMCYATPDDTSDVEFFGYSAEAAQLCPPPA